MGVTLSAVIEIIKGRVFLPKDTKPSFAGRNVLVTGANTGLGYAAALKFVQLGAEKVILGVRLLEKGERARGQIEVESGRKGVVEVWELDMMDYESLKNFAARVERELSHLDIACLNAGVMATKFEVGRYGWEKDLQTNLLSTVLLSLLLLPKMKSSKTADFTPALELVSSSTQYRLSLQPSARKADSPLEFYNTPVMFKTFEQYTISKLFLQYALSHLLTMVGKKESPSVYIVAVCPGAVKTGITRDFKGWYMDIGQKLADPLIMRSPEQGARTYVSGVTLGLEGHGKFWSADRIKEPAPMLVGAENEEFGHRVWRDVLRVLRKDVSELDQMVSKMSAEDSLRG